MSGVRISMRSCQCAASPSSASADSSRPRRSAASERTPMFSAIDQSGNTPSVCRSPATRATAAATAVASAPAPPPRRTPRAACRSARGRRARRARRSRLRGRRAPAPRTWRGGTHANPDRRLGRDRRRRVRDGGGVSPALPMASTSLSRSKPAVAPAVPRRPSRMTTTRSAVRQDLAQHVRDENAAHAARDRPAEKGQQLAAPSARPARRSARPGSPG